jgi:hypothetical protein
MLDDVLSLSGEYINGTTLGGQEGSPRDKVSSDYKSYITKYISNMADERSNDPWAMWSIIMQICKGPFGCRYWDP